MKSLVLFLVMMLSIHAKAAAGGGFDHGNGGDMCENRFYSIRNDVTAWILKGGSKGLVLPGELSLEKYNQGMLDQMKAAKVSCTEDKIFVGKAEKTCKNFVTPEGSAFITCNVNRFKNTSEEDQYVLVHHEYAGLAGFETNTEEVSDYEISNQITGYLADQVVKKLVVKPNGPPSGWDGPWPWDSVNYGNDGEWLIEDLNLAVFFKSAKRDNTKFVMVKVYSLHTCSLVGQGMGIEKNGTLKSQVTFEDSIETYSFGFNKDQFVVAISDVLGNENNIYKLVKLFGHSTNCIFR